MAADDIVEKACGPESGVVDHTIKFPDSVEVVVCTCIYSESLCSWCPSEDAAV